MYNEKIDDLIKNTVFKRKNNVIKRKDKIVLVCENNHKLTILYDNLLKKKNFICKKCENIKRFYEMKKQLEEEGYKIISKESDFKRVDSKIKIECPKGHFTTITYNHFKEGKRCRYCCKTNKLDECHVKQYIEKHGYKMLSKYINATTPLVLVCPEGHINYTLTWANFRKGERCRVCNKHEKKDIDFIKEEFPKEGYTVLQDFYNSNSEGIKVSCPNGHITNTITWSNWKKGKRCKICNESKGEKFIKEKLESLNISFIREKAFDDCVYKAKLLFDFFIPEFNICIEYDGIQHFEPVEHFGGAFELENIKKRDKIKNEYCKKKNIKLIRIPYWEKDNIEKIIENIFK